MTVTHYFPFYLAIILINYVIIIIKFQTLRIYYILDAMLSTFVY